MKRLVFCFENMFSPSEVFLPQRPTFTIIIYRFSGVSVLCQPLLYSIPLLLRRRELTQKSLLNDPSGHCTTRIYPPVEITSQYCSVQLLYIILAVDSVI